MMEELRNNETSEKKERIEPLEVVTLEGDAIPAEGEATDSPCVRRGNLYKKDALQLYQKAYRRLFLQGKR